MTIEFDSFQFKTVSEVKEQEGRFGAERQKAWDAHLVLIVEYVECLRKQNRPLYKETRELHPVIPNDMFVEALRERVRDILILNGRLLNMVCDNCKVRMVEIGGVLLSHPPRQQIGCPGCGFSDIVLYKSCLNG